jgi:hypothetical protein
MIAAAETLTITEPQLMLVARFIAENPSATIADVRQRLFPTGPANPECRNPKVCDRSHRMPSRRECSAAWLTLEPSERMRRRQEARVAA